jgi:hypothetical protein
MRTTVDSGAPLDSHSAGSTYGTRHVPTTQLSVTHYQAAFLNFLSKHDAAEFSKSLKCIHDLAIYHSDLLFDEEEKKALYYLKVLWEGFDQMME